MLVLAGLVLFVVWYFVGGKQQIASELVMYRTARGGWDVSQADRYPHYGLLCHISLPVGLILLTCGLANVTVDAIRKARKAINDSASKAN